MAKNLGVSSSTVRHWELGRKAPKLRHRSALLAFLDDEPPREDVTTFAEALRAARRALGLSQRRLAELVGFGCPDTVADWENGVRTPMPRHLERLKQFFEEADQPLAFIDLAAEKFAVRRSEATSKAWTTRRALRRGKN